MDFTLKKPSHLFAFILVMIAFSTFILFPILSFFGFLSSPELDQIEQFPYLYKIIFEILLVAFQLILTIGLFIFVPFLWYVFVNKLSISDIFNQLKLKRKGLDMAFLWGIVTMFLAFFLIAVFGVILIFFGYDLTDSSNIPQLESLFSLPAILILIIIQPVAEEFFFRGFLLDKTTNLLGTKTAIILTSILFGIAHLSFRNVYPAVTTAMIGLLLAYSVVKTNNLSTSIIAHVLFNIASFSIYLIGKSFHLQSVIL